MARMSTKGMDAVIDSMVRMGEGTGKLADDMLRAADEITREEWKESGERHRLKDTGEMISSLDRPSKVRTAKGVRMVDVYPRGKDRKGVRNAEKAFILHYGTEGSGSKRALRNKKKKHMGKGNPETGWVDEAMDRAEPRVTEMMERMFDDFINK